MIVVSLVRLKAYAESCFSLICFWAGNTLSRIFRQIHSGEPECLLLLVFRELVCSHKHCVILRLAVLMQILLKTERAHMLESTELKEFLSQAKRVEAYALYAGALANLLQAESVKRSRAATRSQ